MPDIIVIEGVDNVLITQSNATEFSVIIPSGPPGADGVGGGGHIIQNEGTALTARTGLNFIGSAITAADDAGNDRTNVTVTLPVSSETVVGIVELATTAETTTGTDTTRATTAAGVKAVADTKAALAHVHAAADVTTGVFANALLPQATTIAGGKVELATVAEVLTGTDTTRAVTSDGVKAVADLKAALSHTHAAVAINAGIIATARLGSGTANATTFLRGDQTYAVPSGGGGSVATDAIFDVKGDLPVGTGANTAARLAVGPNGKVLRAASGEATGLLWDDDWVYAVATADTANSTTTPSNIAGLQIPALADGLWEIECLVVGSSSTATTGLWAGMVNNATGATLTAYGFAGSGTGTMTFHTAPVGTALGFTPNAAPSGTATFIAANIRGTVRAASMTGTLDVTVRSEVGASLVTAKADSFIRWRRIAA